MRYNNILANNPNGDADCAMRSSVRKAYHYYRKRYENGFAESHTENELRTNNYGSKEIDAAMTAAAFSLCSPR